MANNTTPQQIDLSVIKIFGKPLDEAGGKTPTGKKCLLKFKSTAADGKPTRASAVDGNGAKPDMMLSHVVEPEDDPGTVGAYFVPLKAGPQKVTIRYNGRKLTPNPLVIEAVGADCDVTVHGRGFELGKAFVMNSFVVDCSGVQPPIGGLKVHIKGPPRSSAPLNIVDNENGTYNINYKPTSTGMYTITVKVADHDIPGSPFQTRVTEFLS
ncbi:hypothetical protein TYRP_015179 [Tyrophagus putrescentiae]|nr:hypothetical protein TYRP_015179 [Tyrophagus putrescentiae]